MPDQSNRIVHGLWIGEYLSTIELLTIASFLANGHTFWLWIYSEIQTPIPTGVVLKNAAEIISKENVFNYNHRNQYWHGKGSYAGFSDIFRYKLLYEYGGWWADMDITCIKPLDFTEPYVFRTHHDFGVVGNLIKCPPKSELMKICFEQAHAQINANNKDWNKPIAILNENIEKLKLNDFTKNISNADSWNLIRKLLVSNISIPKYWYVIHWVNEEWRRNKIDKNYYRNHSTLGQLMLQYNIPKNKKNTIQKLIEFIKLTYLIAGIRQIPSFVASRFVMCMKKIERR